MAEDLFRAPPHLAHLKHLRRYAERVSRESAQVGEDLTVLEQHAQAFAAVWSRLMIVCGMDADFAELDQKIGELFDDGDPDRPLTVTEALNRVQNSDDRKSEFDALVRCIPSSLREARAQAKYVIDAVDAGGTDLTLEQALALIRSIAAPPWITRVHELEQATE